MPEFYIRTQLRDGTVQLAGPIDGDHDYADRLAREMQRDPQVLRTEVVLVSPAEPVAVVA